MTTPTARRWSTFGDVSDDWPATDLGVEILHWNPDEALARIGGSVIVRVRHSRGFARWRCSRCGISRGWAACEHSRAVARTVVPLPHPAAPTPAPTARPNQRSTP